MSCEQPIAQELKLDGKVDSASGDVVTLRVWGAEEDQDLLSELIGKFEAQYPDVNFDIQLGVESESTAKDTILTDVEAATVDGKFRAFPMGHCYGISKLCAVSPYECV